MDYLQKELNQIRREYFTLEAEHGENSLFMKEVNNRMRYLSKKISENRVKVDKTVNYMM